MNKIELHKYCDKNKNIFLIDLYDLRWFFFSLVFMYRIVNLCSLNDLQKFEMLEVKVHAI